LIRDIIAVVAGFTTMAVIVAGGSITLAAILLPDGVAAMRPHQDATRTPSPKYLSLNIVLSLIAAVIGGRVAARNARADAFAVAIGLCAVIMVMGVLSARAATSSQQPRWYKFLLPIVGVVGVAASTIIA
jgi:hypothetical protein